MNKRKMLDRNTLRQVKAELARRLFREFVREAWDVVEPARPLIPAWHIDAIADHLQAVSEGKIKNLLINVPPGHGKSLIVSVLWPAWQWIRTSRRRSLAGLVRLVRRWTRHTRLRSLPIADRITLVSRDVLGPLGSCQATRTRKSYFRNTASGFRISLSVGGRGTGFRGDAIVVDDPLNASDQYSENARNAALFWWNLVMSSRLNDAETGSRIIIMQRLHDRDLSGHVLEQGTYEHLCLPSEFEPERRSRTSIGWQDPRTEPGELSVSRTLFSPRPRTSKKRSGLGGLCGAAPAAPVTSRGRRAAAALVALLVSARCCAASRPGAISRWIRFERSMRSNCPRDSTP